MCRLGSKLTVTVVAALALGVALPASGADVATTLSQASQESTFSLGLRYRLETVDDDTFAADTGGADYGTELDLLGSYPGLFTRSSAASADMASPAGVLGLRRRRRTDGYDSAPHPYVRPLGKPSPRSRDEPPMNTPGYATPWKQVVALKAARYDADAHASDVTKDGSSPPGASERLRRR